MDDFDFESLRFLEYLEPSFALLFALLKEAKECDTKVRPKLLHSSVIAEICLNWINWQTFCVDLGSGLLDIPRCFVGIPFTFFRIMSLDLNSSQRSQFFR